MSIISKLAPLGEHNNIAIMLAFNKGDVTATVSIKPKKGSESGPTPVQISGPIDEVEKSIESDLEKLTARLLKHSTTLAELDKELEAAEAAKKSKVGKAKETPAAPAKKPTAAEKKAAKKAEKAAAKAGSKETADDKGEEPTSATSATSLLDDM